MTQWQVSCSDGRQFTLRTPLSFVLQYGLGSPCDSFFFRCPWTVGQEDLLADAARLTVSYAGEVVFRGVVDECECTLDAAGCTLSLHGRGLQALLLDNEAAAADYGVATLGDILGRYVTPYGITASDGAALPPVAGFSVQSGSSCWQVLYQFARYHGGVNPRVSKDGVLCLSAWPEESGRVVDDKQAVTRLVWRCKRYGVLSEVLVQNRVTMAEQRLKNEAFHAKGGCCSRVLTVPRNTSSASMRYTGAFQLERSMAEWRRVELSLALPFAAYPGELLTLARGGFGGNGRYRVLESRVTLDETGFSTTLLLGDPQAIL